MLPATSPKELAAMRGAKQIPWMAISRHRELLAKLHALLVDRISVEQKKDIGLELALGMARTVSDVDVLIKKLEGVLAVGRLTGEHYERIQKIMPVEVGYEMLPPSDPFS